MIYLFISFISFLIYSIIVIVILVEQDTNIVCFVDIWVWSKPTIVLSAFHYLQSCECCFYYLLYRVLHLYCPYILFCCCVIILWSCCCCCCCYCCCLLEDRFLFIILVTRMRLIFHIQHRNNLYLYLFLCNSWW